MTRRPLTLRRVLPIALAAALPLALAPQALAGQRRPPSSPSGHWPGGGYTSHACPAPQQLVKDTTWTRHNLAPGVTLSEGTATDKTVYGTSGQVNMHVLRIDTTNANLRFAPLVDHFAQRTPLSELAAGNPHLVAATNTGFFDFDEDAPLGPVYANGHPTSIGAVPEPVIGLTASNQIEQGNVSLVGTVTAARKSIAVAGVNYLSSKRGLSIYTSAWGSRAVPFAPRHSNSDLGVIVRDGRTVSRAGLHNHAPASGELLVASSPGTEAWMRRLPTGTDVVQDLRIRTTTPQPMVQAYSVGSPLVLHAGKVDTSLGCDERDTQAARTAIGYTAGGKQLVIVVVADDPGTALHGLDHKEMSKLLVDLGVAKAWQWDGSGSSEMIARIGGTLSIRNYCADGQERPMPVGFGIYNYPAKSPKPSKKNHKR